MICRVGVGRRRWTVRMSDVDVVFIGMGESVDDRWRWEVVLGLFSEAQSRWLAMRAGKGSAYAENEYSLDTAGWRFRGRHALHYKFLICPE